MTDVTFTWSNDAAKEENSSFRIWAQGSAVQEKFPAPSKDVVHPREIAALLGGVLEANLSKTVVFMKSTSIHCRVGSIRMAIDGPMTFITMHMHTTKKINPQCRRPLQPDGN